MVGKKKFPNIFIATIIILGIFIIAILILLFQKNRQSGLESNNTTDTSKPRALTQMQKSETANKSEIDTAVTNYIHNQYPAAQSITTSIEYVGLGYAILNTTYTLDSAEVTKKIYLEYQNGIWNFLHESEGQITCDTAKQIAKINSPLMLNCKE